MCPNCGFGSSAAPAMAPPPAPAPAPVATGGWAQTSPPAAGYAMPPPGPPAWNAKPPRPGWVTFVAVYDFIGGSFAILVGLALLLGGAFVGALFDEFGDAVGALLSVVGFVILAIGILEVILGVYILKGAPWARMVNLVLAILGIVVGAISLLSIVLTGDPSGIIGLALSILVVVALTRPESKAFFGVH